MGCPEALRKQPAEILGVSYVVHVWAPKTQDDLTITVLQVSFCLANHTSTAMDGGP